MIWPLSVSPLGPYSGVVTDTVADPELDPTATYAVDVSEVRRLARLVMARPSAEELVVHTPLTGAPIARWPISTAEDVETAITRARAAQRAWGRAPVAARARIMLRFHDLLLAQQGWLLDAIQLESGKARRHAFEEIAETAACARHYARASAGYLRPRRHLGVLPLLTQPVEIRHPKGVVGLVSPWNYPLSLSISDAIPALMAGNAVVLRPDVQATLTALRGAELLCAAGLPEGVLQVVVGPGPTTGQAVVDRADYISYTGSTATGRRVAVAAAERLVGASLELGGKNALYVAADANLRRAVEGAVRSCFSSAGQLCISTERVIVHRDIADAFLPRFVEAVKAMTLGTGLHYGIDMGSLVGPRQLETVTRHVEDAVAKGARVLTGGRARPDIGPYVFEPTVLADVTSEMACRDEETFGPVVAVYVVDSDEAAIALANDTEYGLNASVWTRDTRRGRDIARRIHTGTVNVNEGYGPAYASIGAPMGGMKQSGLGRRHGRDGILKFTEPQTVAVQHVMGLGGVPGVSDERFAQGMTLGLRALKGMGLR